MNIIKPVILIGLVGFSTQSLAADMYFSGSFSQSNQDNSFNDGSFSANFETGAVTGVTPPLQIPAGAPVSWNTIMDDGDGYSMALGWKMDQFRFEVEYASSSADVRTHQGVSAAGIALGAIDAGVLLTGNVGDLGVSVADLVADGRGEIDSSTVYFNAYYDFNTEGRFTPYIGVGLGYSDIEVNYSPSGVGVINDSDKGLVYQAILGGAFNLGNNLDLFANVRLRDGDDASVQSPLLSANFDVENSSTSFELGLRYHFD